MKKRFVLLISGIIICLGILFYFQVISKNTLKESTVETKNSSIAIMIKENGATDYTKSSSYSIPVGKYKLNKEKTTCENGGKISDYNSETGKIKISLLGADKCYLYFDYVPNYLYNEIDQRYKNSDEFVKLYNPTEFGDATTYDNNIYYFNGAVENNNVLFAGFCWKIVRTTDTGGIKMIYNGIPKDTYEYNEQINNDQYNVISNDTTYPYTFDVVNKIWKSNVLDDSGSFNAYIIEFGIFDAGNYELTINMNNETYEDVTELYLDDTLIGAGDEGGEGSFVGLDSDTIDLTLTTSNVLKVVYYKNSTTTDNSDYVMFSLKKGVEGGKDCNNSGEDSQLNTGKNFNNYSDSLAYVGYMYNKIYPNLSKQILSETNVYGATYMVANSVTYSNGTYTLANPSSMQIIGSNASNLKGKYTCGGRLVVSCSHPMYVTEILSSIEYPTTIMAYYYKLSDGVIDGTSYSKNYLFGNTFTYSNGIYTLSNPVTVNTDDFSNNSYSSAKENRYTCFTTGATCSSLYYVYYISYGKVYYIALTEGKSVEDAINEMLYADDVNKNDSTIKTYIDSWYKENMTSYTDKLEDTIFCNDRTILNKNGWDPNSGSKIADLQLKNYSVNYSLACLNETDRFSVSNTKAKLTYPVGLLSAPEAWLAMKNSDYNTYYLKNNNVYWLISPSHFNYNSASVKNVAVTGDLGSVNVKTENGIRPVISLKPNTEYTSGDGSYTNPFIVE